MAQAGPTKHSLSRCNYDLYASSPLVLKSKELHARAKSEWTFGDYFLVTPDTATRRVINGN